MAITDTLDGFIQAKIQVALAEREGDVGGGKELDHDVSPHINDGTVRIRRHAGFMEM